MTNDSADHPTRVTFADFQAEMRRMCASISWAGEGVEPRRPAFSGLEQKHFSTTRQVSVGCASTSKVVRDGLILSGILGFELD